MSVASTSIMSTFVKLREKVIDELNSHREEFERNLRRLSTAADIHYKIMALGVLVLVLVVLSPVYTSILRSIPYISTFPFLPFVAAVLILIIAFPSGFVYSRSHEYPILTLAFTLFCLPVLLIILDALPKIWLNTFYWKETLIVLLLFMTLNVVVFSLVYGSLIIVSSRIPTILFSSWTSVNSGHSRGIVPSYEKLIEKAFYSVKTILDELTPEEVSQISDICQFKLNGINGRVQSLSFLIGGIALISLGAVEQFISFLDTLITIFKTYLGTNVEISGKQLLFLAIVVLILFVVLYFNSIYREIQVLEIMVGICILHKTINAAPALKSPQSLTSTTQSNISFRDALITGVVSGLLLLVAKLLQVVMRDKK